MRNRYAAVIVFVTLVHLIAGLPLTPAVRAERDQASIVAAEISTIANLLSIRPETAIDLSKISGEYCFNVKLEEGGQMTHFAIDPMSTQEDVVDFINAAQFTEAGIEVDKLPRFPGKLGSMTPNKWYYLPAGEFEPHHGIKFPFPLLMRAVNLK